jgi:hypothetical protein
MIKEIVHIISHFDKSDFKDVDMTLWKTKFYGGTIVVYYDDMYISIENIFAIAANSKKVQIADLKSF